VNLRPDDGLKVLARGRVSLYEPRGAYQIIVEAMEPAGLGALQLAFEQLKTRLQAEGLFDAARKRPLPLLPRRLGIVTSPSGAAISDILRVLSRRFANLEVVIAPARVQGDGAAATIVQGIRDLGRLVGCASRRSGRSSRPSKRTPPSRRCARGCATRCCAWTISPSACDRISIGGS